MKSEGLTKRTTAAASQRKQSDRALPSRSRAKYGPSHDIDNFVPHPFAYNARIWLMFLPAACILVLFGGKLTVGTVAVGLIITFLLDAVGTAEISFVTFWVTLVSTIIGLYAKGIYLFKFSLFNGFLLMNMGLFTALTGLWGSLQFKWLMDTSPLIVVTMERMLFATYAYPCSVIITWGITAVSGVGNAPFYLMGLLTVAHYVLHLPLQSSFSLKHQATRGGVLDYDEYILGRAEGAMHAMAYMLLPAIFYVGVHHQAFTFNAWPNITNMAMLIFGPLLLMLVTKHRHTFMWTGLSEEGLETLYRILTPIVLFVLVGCVEYRVVFHSLFHYITLLPPYNYIIVTAACYGTVGLIYLHFAGYMKPIGQVPLIIINAGLAVGVSLVVGAPFIVLLAMIASAITLTLFYFERQLLYYVSFVGFSTVSLAWFIYRTFWFLDLEMNALGVPITLHGLAFLLSMLFVLSLLIPGLTIINQFPNLTGFLLTVHAFGLAMVEELVYEEFPGSYPPYLIAITSAVGIYMASSLQEEARISVFYQWSLTSVHAAKVALLLTPVNMAQPSAFLLVATISPLYCFYTDIRMPTHIGILHGASVGFAAFLTRDTLLARIAHLIFLQDPSPSLQFALFLLVWAIGCLPLSYRFFPHVPAVRRINTLLLAAGLLFAIVQPPLGYDAALEEVTDSFARAGSGDQSATWPLWCLFAALVIAVAGLAGVVPIQRSEAIRAIFCLVLGFCLGLYISGSFLPPSGVTYSLFCVIVTLTIIILVFGQIPTTSSSKIMPLLFALLVTLFPVTAVMQSYSHVGSGASQKENTKTEWITLLALYDGISLVIAIWTKITLSNASPRRASSAASNVSRRFGAQASAPQAQHAALATDLVWLPVVGNFATILAFAITMWISVHYLHGSDTSIFLIAPMLLLLSRDNYWLRHLSDDRRYAPIIWTISGYLFGVAIVNSLLRHVLSSYELFNTTVHVHVPFTTFTAGKNLSLSAIAAPAHYLFNKYLWDFHRQSWYMWICIIPLNLLPIIFTDFFAIQMLGVLGILGGIVVLIVSQQTQGQGQKFI